MDFRSFVAKQGLKLLQSPRVTKLMQDERVMKGVVGALQFRVRLQARVDSQLQRVAERLQLVTASDLRELKDELRRVETELEKASSRKPGDGSR